MLSNINKQICFHLLNKPFIVNIKSESDLNLFQEKIKSTFLKDKGVDESDERYVISLLLIELIGKIALNIDSLCENKEWEFKGFELTTPVAASGEDYMHDYVYFTIKSNGEMGLKLNDQHIHKLTFIIIKDENIPDVFFLDTPDNPAAVSAHAYGIEKYDILNQTLTLSTISTFLKNVSYML